jgi:uncharacterized iron-regulated membrane protein
MRLSLNPNRSRNAWKGLRGVLFWSHLTAGCAAGVVILTMCATGALLAFQPQILRAVERSARTVHGSGTAAGERLGPGALVRLAADAFPGAAPTAVTIAAAPSEAAAVAFGRQRLVYLDPVSGSLLGEGAAGWRGFFAGVQDLHRWLAFGEDERATGKAITGAANLAFLGLALSGLYIWWPRLRGLRRVRSVGVFQRGLSGKARDFNWHNVIGVWTALPLVVVTATGAVISYRWASDLVYRASGSTPPPAAAERGFRPRGGAPLSRAISAEEADALDRMWITAGAKAPGWRAMTLRLPEGRGPVAVSIEETRFFNRSARSQLTLDPKTGAVVKWEPYDANTGRQARSWMRFLHTGEAVGPLGQLLAAMASLGGAFLVATGISLSLRRFLSWRWRRAEAAARSRPEPPSMTGEGQDLAPAKGALR